MPIYFDYAATTPVDPRVAEKMAECLTLKGIFGNPASIHSEGFAAKKKVDEARAQVADLISADPLEIVWTSGATEANNLALKGAASLYQSRGKHIVTLKTEHPSVLDPCRELEKAGFFVTYLTPEKNGLLDLEKLQRALSKETILLSVMHVNNEIGIIQNIQAIAEITASRGILCHVDAAQSAGKMPIDMQKTPVDLMSFSAHKIYGPKGMGALYLRRKPRVRVAAQIHGGGQEQGMRSGTLATHQIVGMGEAFYLAKKEMGEEAKRLQALRDYFIENLKKIKNCVINFDEKQAIPSILNMRFDHIDASTLMRELPNLAISAGSACLSKGIEPSYVLRALGQSEIDARAAVRFSLGRWTTREEIDFALNDLRALKTQY